MKDCKSCRYRQLPKPPKPFSAADANNPETIRTWLEWNRQLDERRKQEEDLFENDDPFFYEPWFFDICRRWMEIEKPNWPVDAFGNQIVVYELCTIRNENHDCVEYIQKGSDR